MTRDGLVEEPDKNTWRLSPAAFQVDRILPTPLRSDVSFIMDKYGRWSADQLINWVYRRYPWFTVNSKISTWRSQVRPVAGPAVYTMGYEGLSVEMLLNELMSSGVGRLIDVRSNPISRRYGFHQSTLRTLCIRLDIEYVHLPELGIRSEDRRGLNSLSDYESLFAEYRREVASQQVSTLRRLARDLGQKPGALVCMEADPESCHRSHLASLVAPIAGLPVVHLGWPR